ncbi:hypothetical protein BLL42_28290 (plasmid) [Pseudomonas frederiksbergensis]|uniref:Inverse autotransporter beta-domain domain-containing protein n=2 Tax=Pseudomonas frederiksbergensis TaxID=104087 RepID=A0A1J0ETZ3_9PSED|nr:hypothetical protein BLL42_28290 [Pseudomonas frederiksbergensis]
MGMQVVAGPMAAPLQANAKQTARQVYVLYVPLKGETLVQVAQRFDVKDADLLAQQRQAQMQGWLGPALLVEQQANGESQLYPAFVLQALRKGQPLGALALSVNRSERELRNLNALLMGNERVSSLQAGDWVLVPAPAKPLAAQAGVEKEQANRQAQKVESTLVSAATTVDGMLGRGRADQSPGSVLSQQLEQQALGAATGGISQGIEGLLNSTGKARVGVQASTASNDVDLNLDYLHPLLESKDGILFTQVGARTFDERTIGNFGLGYRHQFNSDLMVGANTFIDQDFSRHHTRLGIGAELWTEQSRFATNYYTPLSDWKQSSRHELNTDPLRKDLYERPAQGWDVRAETSLPGAPSFAVTGKYFQWKGDGVDAYGSGQLEKNPKGYGLGLKWQPIPLIGVSAERQQIQSGDGQWVLSANFTWSFDQDLGAQLSGSGKGMAIKPLEQSRKEFVDRNYNIVLDYKQKAKYLDFGFAIHDMAIPANNTNGPVFYAAPPVKGVPAGGVVRYDITGISPAAAADEVTVNAQTGQLTVAKGAQAQVISLTAYLFMPKN